MKIFKKMFMLATTFALGLSLVACGSAEEETEEAETMNDVITMVEDVEIDLIDSDLVTLKFAGFDEDGDMYFWFGNKTGETVNIYFSYVSLDGETYEVDEEVEFDGEEGNFKTSLVTLSKECTYFAGIFVVEDEDYEILATYEIANTKVADGDSEAPEFDAADGVSVLSNDDLEIYYMGTGSGETYYDDEDDDEEITEECLMFLVYNKTDSFIQIAADSITVDGEEYEPSYVAGAFAGGWTTLYVDVDDDVKVSKIKELTCTFATYDAEDEELETYDVDGVSLK